MGAAKYNDETVFKRSEEIVDRKNNNENVIVLMKMDDSSSFYKIRGVATEVWELLSEGKPVKTIIEEITGRYEAPKDKIREDVEKFLNELMEMDVISAS